MLIKSFSRLGNVRTVAATSDKPQVELILSGNTKLNSAAAIKFGMRDLLNYVAGTKEKPNPLPKPEYHIDMAIVETEEGEVILMGTCEPGEGGKLDRSGQYLTATKVSFFDALKEKGRVFDISEEPVIEAGVTQVTDENGEPVLDGEGNPIYYNVTMFQLTPAEGTTPITKDEIDEYNAKLEQDRKEGKNKGRKVNVSAEGGEGEGEGEGEGDNGEGEGDADTASTGTKRGRKNNG